MLVYKLTNQDNTTKNNTLWGENVSHEATGYGRMCGPGWLHAYSDPRIAVLMNMAHGRFMNPKLWEAKGEGEFCDDYGKKCGFTKLTTIKETRLPELTKEQRIRIGILYVKEAYNNPCIKSNLYNVQFYIDWNKWADEWLNAPNETNLSKNLIMNGPMRYLAEATQSKIHFTTSVNVALAITVINRPINLLDIIKTVMEQQ